MLDERIQIAKMVEVITYIKTAFPKNMEKRRPNLSGK
jgi:hypothetical protein